MICNQCVIDKDGVSSTENKLFTVEKRDFCKLLDMMSPEVGTCAATISLTIALVLQLFLSGCAAACASSIFAIFSAIAQVQVKYDYE